MKDSGFSESATADVARTRVPMSAEAWCRQIGWLSVTRSAEHVLDQLHIERRVLEDWTPLCEALEWRVSAQYWQRAGVLPFAENRVPYLVNNSGRLSDSAADILFSSCLDAPPTGAIRVVEFGAGTGLFARLFLNAFRDLCVAAGRDFYRRLVYVVTDHSATTVSHWSERAIFADHVDRVELRVADADVGFPLPSAVRAVFCNYVLDVLPATIVRLGADGEPEQLCVRTHLADDATCRAHTQRAFEELRSVVVRNDPAALHELAPLVSLFIPEIDWRPLSSRPSALALALETTTPLEPTLLNHAAISCIMSTLQQLDSQGFILINDYGPSRVEQVAEHATCQRFGSTSAVGLNFPLLERAVAQQGACTAVPSGDEQRHLHSRLITKKPLPAAVRVFEERFGIAGHALVEEPLELARAHVQAGRVGDALSAYRVALSRNARDWALIGEVAEYVINAVRDPRAALDLCRSAVDLNPFYSAWLWNLMGDALYCLERFDDAHGAYLQAERVDPHDGRTNLNLAYVYLQRAQHGAALGAIARGLAHDDAGVYRDRLLEKQQQVLAALAVRSAAEQQRLTQRHERLRGNDGLVKASGAGL